MIFKVYSKGRICAPGKFKLCHYKRKSKKKTQNVAGGSPAFKCCIEDSKWHSETSEKWEWLLSDSEGVFKLTSTDTCQFKNANAGLIYPIKILLSQFLNSLLYINWLCLILFSKGKVSTCLCHKVIDLNGGCVRVLGDILKEVGESSASGWVTANSHWVKFFSYSIGAWADCNAQRHSKIQMVNMKGLTMKEGFCKCSRSNFKVGTPRCPSSLQRTHMRFREKIVVWLSVKWTAAHWCGFTLCGVCGNSYSSDQIQPLLSKLFMPHF